MGKRDRDRDDDRGMTSSAKFVYSLLSLDLWTKFVISSSQPLFLISLFEPFNQDSVNFCSDWLLKFLSLCPRPCL